MQLFSSVLLSLQVISSLLIIVLVLLQQGKGADMGAAFGSGSAGSVFGSAGAANFLSRATKWAAVLFFATTIGLAWISHHPAGAPLDSGIMSGFMSSEPAPAPATGSAVPDLGAAVPSSVPAAPGVGQPAAGADAAIPSSAPAAVNSDASVPSVPSSVPDAGGQPAEGSK